VKQAAVLLAFFISSCVLYFPKIPEKMKVKEDVFAWIQNNYCYAYDEKEYWQHPQETLERMEGDCEDWTILSIWLLKSIGIEAEMAVIALMDS
jgi:predicted transglutaminase-like cysteine proteinase